jgi:aminopeptidase N
MCLLAVPAAGLRPYHVEHYDATLRLDATSGRLTGAARLRIESTADALTSVELDAAEMSITEVRSGRHPLPFVQHPDAGEGGTVTITLPRPLALGKRCLLALRYTGTPTRGMRLFSDQVWTAFSTSHWLPSDSRPDNRATVQLGLDLPSGWQVVAAGRCIRQHARGGRLLSTWDQRVPLPSFVFGFAAGRFQFAEEDYGGVRLRSFSARHTPEELSRLNALARPMLGFFAGRAGVAYPGASYTQVFARDTPMQEVGGFTLLPEQYADDLLAHPDELWLVAHELAHQWWGIGVTCRTWSDFWLNEGIATFLADVYLGERFGDARYRREIEHSRQVWTQLKQEGQDRPLHFTGWTTPQQAGGRLPYHKGARVLHLLREELGADAFWRGLGAYTREHWLGSATSADLRQAMERASGRSLAAFFGAWVYE